MTIQNLIIVGLVSAFHVSEYFGRPLLFGDLHVCLSFFGPSRGCVQYLYDGSICILSLTI